MTNASTVLEGHAPPPPPPVQMYNNGHEYDFISRAFINSTSLLIYDIPVLGSQKSGLLIGSLSLSRIKK